jgi:hypothetical protein
MVGSRVTLRFFSDLARIGVGDIERVLDQLSTRTPVRVDIPPQQLPRAT